MAGTPTTFKAFGAKTLLRADKLLRAVALETFDSTITDTPVGNPDLWKRPNSAPAGYVGGRLRSNWRCSVAAPDMTTDESTNINAPLSKVAEVCATVSRKDSVWLANSLPYAATIEYDGHSTQAPAGMVRRNVARVKSNIKKFLAKSKS